MSIEKRLERLEAILDARGLDWDHPMVAEEPAKEREPEHPAGPKPDPGEGYRILSKDPLEDLTPGDEFGGCNGKWIRSWNAETTKKQGATCWYRRKIEVAQPPEPEYREPVLPADVGKLCEFSINGNDWTEGKLRGYACHLWQSVSSEVVGANVWMFARIKKDA